MIKIRNAYTPEQYARVVAAWEQLLTTHGVNASYNGVGGRTIEPTHLYELVMSDGEETEDEYPVEVSVLGYGYGYGSDRDAANIRYLAEEYPWVDADSDTNSGYLRVQLGTLPGTSDADVAEAISELEAFVKDIGSVLEGDTVVFDDEIHSAYIAELADEAWDSWLCSDVRSDVVDALNGPDGDYDIEDFGYSDDELKEMFWSFETGTGEFANAEAADSVYFPYREEATAWIINEIITAWTRPAADPDQLSIDEAA